jgi:hypothetical protein
MSKENMPPWIKIYWKDNPAEYEINDIYHIEPGSLSAVFAKNLALKSGYTPDEEYYLKTNTDDYFLTNTGGKFVINTNN